MVVEGTTLDKTRRFAANIATLTERTRSAREELERMSSVTSQLREQCDSQEKEMATLEQEQHSTKAEVQSLRKKIDLLLGEKEKIEGKLEELRTENAKLDFFTKQLASVTYLLGFQFLWMDAYSRDIEILKQAVEADYAGDKGTALVFYTELCAVLELIAQAEQHAPKRSYARKRAMEYMQRAEELKSVPRLGVLHPMESVLARVYVEQATAVRNDVKLFYDLAFDYYLEVTSLLCSALLSDVSPNMNTALMTKISYTIQRAEEIHSASIFKRRESGQAPPSSALSLTPKELHILKSASTINSITYFPWLSIDLKEQFWSNELYNDPTGKLELSRKQIAKFGAWKRPSEFMLSPKVICMISSNSICQDMVTDCSFVASLCVSAAYERRFRRQLITSCIFPQDRHGIPIYNPSGKYMVKLHFNGIHRKIEIQELICTGALSTELCSDLGLIPTHAYAVLDIREVCGLRLLQIKNPWNHKRWKGAFSPSDHLNWSAKLKEELNFDQYCALQIDDASSSWPYYLYEEGYSNLNQNPQYGLEVNDMRNGALVWLLLSKHSLQTEENTDFITLNIYSGTDCNEVYYHNQFKTVYEGVFMNRCD
ncbi:calpain 7 [Dinochytrium kinnereticum]|nr:calpain 7 [Dinochytrium kinnereticum]